MATNPEIPSPDTINPQSPQEMPAETPSREEPMRQPDEVDPVKPDYDQPDTGPVETPPPDDDGQQLNDAEPVDGGGLGAQMGFGPIGTPRED